MKPPYRLLGISGSLRANSFSSALLAALVEATAERAIFDYSDIGAVPHFNQDLYVDPLPPSVQKLRDQILEADGLVVVSSEYNHGIPGTLKNALDWASRPHNQSPLKNKPALIITSSVAVTGGVRAQYQIRETLISALARPVSTPEIVVGNIAAKIVGSRFEDPSVIAFALAGIAEMFNEVDRLVGR
ncbi:chromate reductase [Sphingobium xenophagum]|uniref:Chromate reductase n=1 Tax=Sphingobium xenophagum TaxID=121428 RepID=A0ABU1X5M3_SPHXE|nr:NADPH-dependent FMN reductase [Sphingobium xenophagum]MDR7156868.1 chromate reductase [Sphingobium xenophagum]